MVETMGMSDKIGPRNIATGQSGGSGPMAMMNPQMQSGTDGTQLLNLVDEEVDAILNDQYARGMKLITENRDILDKIAKTLIESEKIDGIELLSLIEDIRPELVPEGAKAKVEEYTVRGKPAPLEAAATATEESS